jgi:hypothetical protein
MLKENGNQADFLGFLHKPVWHRSLTLCFEPFNFDFEFAEIFVIEKRLAESASRRLAESESRRLVESGESFFYYGYLREFEAKIGMAHKIV